MSLIDSSCLSSPCSPLEYPQQIQTTTPLMRPWPLLTLCSSLRWHAVSLFAILGLRFGFKSVPRARIRKVIRLLLNSWVFLPRRGCTQIHQQFRVHLKLLTFGSPNVFWILLQRLSWLFTLKRHPAVHRCTLPFFPCCQWVPLLVLNKFWVPCHFSLFKTRSSSARALILNTLLTLRHPLVTLTWLVPS